MANNGLFAEHEVTNAKTTIKGSILTVEIDISKNFGPSASGKTLTVASTKGFKKVPGTNVSLNLNVTTK